MRALAFDQDLQMPYTQSYSVGWQRKLTRDSALEIRYVGSKHENDWDSVNLNEPDIVTNGFVNEFRMAQANLLQHLWRDINTGSRHAVINSNVSAEAFGRELLGLDEQITPLV